MKTALFLKIWKKTQQQQLQNIFNREQKNINPQHRKPDLHFQKKDV